MKQMINTLPVPTFRWLKINGTLVDEGIMPKEESVFTVKEGTAQTLLLLDDGKKEDLSARYSLILERDSELNLIQVIKDARGKPAVQQIKAVCKENAHLNVFWIFTGGSALYPQVTADLEGEGSSLALFGAYVVLPGQILDMSIVSNHIGKNTDTKIDVKGVLYDKAKKVFRGTIDFKPGCKGATGDEREDVLLMDDEAINQSVPLILCAEEDVSGNHGASIGRIDEDEQFYMLSRGLCPEEIEQILLSARINAVIEKMPPGEQIKVKEALGLK